MNILRIVAAIGRLALALARLVARPPSFDVTINGRPSGRITVRRWVALRLACAAMWRALLMIGHG
jgi:ribosomal protein S9